MQVASQSVHAFLGCTVCTAQMRPIATDLWSGRSVRPSVCHVTDRYPAKMAGPIKMPFGMCVWVGHSNHVLDVGLDPPGEEPIFRWGSGRPRYRDNGE